MDDAQRAIIMIKNMRRAALQRGPKSTDYEAGFFSGWCTACGAILAALGVDPSDVEDFLRKLDI